MRDSFFEKGDLVEHSRRVGRRAPRLGNIIDIRARKHGSYVHVEWAKGLPKAAWYRYDSLRAGHLRTGNCWEDAELCKRCRDLCDVCHQHDEPRGECDACARCPTCDAADDADASARAAAVARLRYPDVS